MLDHVLLDLDGTLLDSTEPVLRAYATALTSMGLEPLERSELSRVIGPPLPQSVPALLAERGVERPHEALPTFARRYREAYRTDAIELARTYPGMAELVRDQAEAGPPQSIVTSKPRDQAVPILEHLDLLRCFAVVEGPGPDEAETKTEVMARALVQLGRPAAARLVMVGDREHDVEAADAHGVATIGVTWGFGSREELRAAGAAPIVDDAAALRTALAQR